MKPNNPFVIYGYVSPEYFCDRQKETETIKSALLNERNLTLIAPRRMGKTGLIKNTFYQMNHGESNIKCFYIDIFGTNNLNEFVSLLGSSILGQLDTLSQSVLQKITGFFKSCRPVITVDEVSGMPSISLDIVPEQESVTLKEIFDYIALSNQKCYIAIDEFQQITEYPQKGVEALLRSYIQFIPNIHFVFSGSKQHIMTEMFASAKRPFYQSTQIMALAEIDEEKYLHFAEKWFSKEERRLLPEAFQYIYQKFEGHTWYIQFVLNRLYSQQMKEITIQDVDAICTLILQENEFMYQNYLALLTENQAKLVKAIAKEGSVTAVNSSSFISKHKLKAASSVNTALKTLREKELVYNKKGEYIVYDRFWKEWLRMQPF